VLKSGVTQPDDVYFRDNSYLHTVNLDQIIEGCRRGDRRSQQQLFSRFYNYTMTIARRYMGSRDLAEEVVSDAFFKVFTKINLYEGAMPFQPWLRRIVINTAIDRLRSNIAEKLNQESLAGIELYEDATVIADLTREQIWAMLDDLPPGYRAVFNLAVVDGYTHEEVAETLGITVGASKSNLSRARQYLRRLLRNEFEFFD
jgi:RNA polymerase sigma-70 factor (ECF subfamily)